MTMRWLVASYPIRPPSFAHATTAATATTLTTAIGLPWPTARTNVPIQSLHARTLTRHARPSRMVLSSRENVSRPRSERERESRPYPARRDGRDGRDSHGSQRDERPQFQGPFAGMNQTVARINPMRHGGGARERVRERDNNNARGRPREEVPQRKALKMQSVLANVSYSRRNTIKDHIDEIKSFDDFKSLIADVRQSVESEALRGMVNIKPTPVQKLAIPALLGQDGSMFESRVAKAGGRGDFLIAAETGSGKTLAYLLPVIHHLKVAELRDPDMRAYKKRMEEEKAMAAKFFDRGERRRNLMDDEPHPSMARPRAVLLMPTSELVDQIGHVAKLISHKAKFKSERISASILPKTIHRNIYSPGGLDLLIATPHLLASIAESDPNILCRVSHLVIDEADSLLDRSFGPVTSDIIDKTMPSLKQLILCTATIPRRLDTFLENRFPDMVRITTPNLHAVPRRVQLGVLDIAREPYRGNRDLACADVIYTIGRDANRNEDGGGADGEMEVKRILVFVNERDETQRVAEYLRSKGIDAVALHRDTTELRRSEALASFTTSAPLRIAMPSADERKSRGRWLPNVKVMVATDLASRGIDTLAVKNVVLYDVPHTAIDFIHRLGRAGRMGRRGKGVVLVGDHDRRDIVREVKESMFMGQALL